MSQATPRMTVVLLAPFGLQELDDILEALAAQTVADSLEIVIGVRQETPPLDEEKTAPFHSVRVFLHKPMTVSGYAKARAVELAQAPIIAFAEDHCFPEPEWAEVLIEAHQEDWGAVAPRMDLANTDSVIAAASFANSFGPWSVSERMFCSNIPTHNTSYRREILLEFGDELGEHLDMEAATLAPDLIYRGYQLLVEPKARIHHINVEKPWPFLVEHFLGGRHYGALRCKDWPLWRRLLYAAGGWLIPIIRLLRGANRSDSTQAQFLLFMGMTVSAFGEAFGYLFGMGNTDALRFEFEYARWKHTKKRYRGRDILRRGRGKRD